MKALVVDMLVPTASNWLDLLRAADLLHLPTLRTAVATFLRDHASLLDGYLDEMTDFPGFLDDVLLSRAIYHPPPPSELLLKQIATAKEAGEKTAPFPVYALLGMVGCYLAYQQLGKIVNLGVMIPVINYVATGAFLVYVVKVMM